MKIVISGGTGFLGRPLTEALAHDGHQVVVLTRQSPTAGTARRHHLAARWLKRALGRGTRRRRRRHQPRRRIDRRSTLVGRA